MCVYLYPHLRTLFSSPKVLISLLLLTLSPLSLSHSSSNMYDYKDDKPYCDFHPRQVIVGVCPLCLNERLLILASKQEDMSKTKETSYRSHNFIERKPPTISLPKIFPLTSFLHRLEFRHKKFDDSGTNASTTPEDSFISIKFEDNGVASWEKSKVSKLSLEHSNMPCNQTLSKEANTSVIEHVKPRAPLRWRKRIGHMFQLIRWKRTNKGSVCHVGSKLEGVKVRNGWIRSLTKRRTQE